MRHTSQLPDVRCCSPIVGPNYGHLDYLTANMQIVHGKRHENYSIYFEFSFPAFSRLAFAVAAVKSSCPAEKLIP